MNTIDLTPVTDRISVLDATIAASTVTLEESAAAATALLAMYDNLLTATEAELAGYRADFERLSEDASLHNAVRERENLVATLDLDLMHVATKYVVTDSDSLLSPAGYHPNTRIFVQTKIAIHTANPSDSRIPASHVPLSLHEIRP